MLPLESPFPSYAARDGSPLDAGFVYFGKPNMNPVTAPIAVYWDAACTQPAAQPLRTTQGHICRAGAPANLFAKETYSTLVKDKRGRTVFTARDSLEFSAASVVAQFLADVGTGTGATKVGFKQSGIGATLRTVQDKLRESVSAFDFPVVCDGVADDTAPLQAAIDALPLGATLDGGRREFIVTEIKIRNDMRLENISLKAKGGAVDFKSPITIDGTVSPKKNIVLSNVHINGNRINQTSILAASEDGGRHGIRMIGACENILIERSSANYCAGDGIELFSSISATGDDNNYVFKNVRIRDCEFSHNRRHGMSGDSIRGLRMDNVTLNYNGLDLNNTAPLDSGARGARQGGNLYGNGIDMEGYGLGSAVNDVRFHQVTGLYNARGGCLFYDALSTRGAGFVARSKIWISDCYFDEGQDASRSGEALTFTSNDASKALSPLYDSIYIDNTRLDGHLLARCVSAMQFSGTISATMGNYFAVLDYATGIVVEATPTGAAKKIYADNASYSLACESLPMPANPVLAFDSGAAGTLSNIVVTPRENRRNRAFTYLIAADWTPSATGTSVFSLTAPVGTSIIDPAHVGVINNDNGAPILSIHNPVGGLLRFANAGIGIVHKLQILVAVYQDDN